MTLAEVDEARVDARMADRGFVINVKEHKTNRAFGPAQVYLTVEEFGWLEQWLQIRETLQPSTDLVFFNENYQKIQNLQHHLQSAWAEMGFSGSPTFTDFRTSIATYARDALSPGTRTKVSKTMCHDTATAEKFYAMHQTAEQLSELRKSFQEATEPSVSGPGEVAEPVTPKSSSDEGEGEGPVKKKRRLAPRVGSTSQESPEAQAESPEGQAESPEGQAESPEGQAESPEGQAESPEDQPESPEGRPESPEGPVWGFQSKSMDPPGSLEVQGDVSTPPCGPRCSVPG
ncbi:uncharacterized protein V3H82_023746 [Fundulus diaphanus]